MLGKINIIWHIFDEKVNLPWSDYKLSSWPYELEIFVDKIRIRLFAAESCVLVSL